MTIKAREFDALADKLGLRVRDGRDLLAWFEYEGRVITSGSVVTLIAIAVR